MQKKLYLAFQSGTGFWCSLIQLVEKDLEHDILAPKPLANHGYLIFETQVAIEAVPPVVRIWDYEIYPRVFDRKYLVPVTDTEYDRALDYALGRVGEGYHYTGQLIAGL